MPYWRLSAFYFFYFAALGTLMPYWGLYLQSLGFDAFAIGSLMAIIMATKVIAPNVWGWLGDHLGQRMLLVRLASLLALAFLLLMAGAHGFVQVALVMACYSFFWNASLPQFEAVVFNHLGNDAERYSRLRLWGSVGFILTVVMVGWLVDRRGTEVVPPALVVVFGGILLSSLLVTDDGREIHETQSSILAVLKKPHILAFFVAVFLMQMSHGPYYAFFSIYLQDYAYSKSDIGLLWSIGVIAEVLLFLFMHRLLQRWRSAAILRVSLTLAALRWLLIGWFPDQLPLLVMAQLLHAASFGSFHASAIHMVHDYFRGRHQGRGQALYASLSFGAGGAVGTFVSGMIWEQWGAPLAYTMASATALLGAWVVWRYIPAAGAEAAPPDS
ncbi:MFS transporter [Thiolapillus brandeum]|uniref:MFS transporter PPP family 3-phenylpropionic acid transporter n=1 Tax=Thiolapillus brandeum TaxID=1076588 RepID=A0A7U6GK72_9GAMM|nr:MFS transporter [Thiolapillus brandeum]BAO45117.1 MFS transporter PPP family 3-phenylpropionic acid transporter [Thiolapillus brandeum]